jgi:hypothetical protein
MPGSPSPAASLQGDRHERFHEWVSTVRDPARLATEGIRRILTANHKAEAEYEIALLPDGQVAVRWSMAYNCGNMSGVASPWSACQNREACVEVFLAVAQRHFGAEINEHKLFESQREARQKMINLLRGGLFGFVEPSPETPAESATDNRPDG